MHALSPGPLRTRAGSGIDRFDELMETTAAGAPGHNLVDLADAGPTAAFLVSNRARTLTGNITYIDAGCHVVG